ncbi:sorting nexin-25 [Octopus bimaculoides]|uniref:Sorting nexin-25 n=1 Tax=Octopus bimaculoides TaxID=37653 RepID=A0A0L8HA24_OCTBM|nr:sorting nexin-25 [Octopus bimaculoides]|eukprot:XP_014774153.1 PREDICTED: sorting nexin-25-like [Octopus bimaculoides]
MKRLSLAFSIGGVALAVFWRHGLFSYISFTLLYASVCLLGVSVGVRWFIDRSPFYRTALPPQTSSFLGLLVQKVKKKKMALLSKQRKVVTSQNLDLAILEVIDLSIRDFVMTWYKPIGKDDESVAQLIKSDIWIVIEKLSVRLSKVDMVKFMTQDLINALHNHFKEIRLSSKTSKESANHKYTIYPWLENEEKEKEFLRFLTNSIMFVLLPTNYAHCDIVRHLLREIFTVSVLKPAIDLLCDPEFINEQLRSYLSYRAKLSEDTRKTYSYAATYEDFVKMIQNCEDIECLKQLRYNIISEILQATTINNWKKSQGISTAKAHVPKSMAKGDLLKARNLKIYINQLTVAKTTCEKRIHAIGGPDYKCYGEGSVSEELTLPGRKIFSVKTVMDTPELRLFFLKFLRRNNTHALLEFWNDVEELKQIAKDEQRTKACQILQQYFSSSNNNIILEKKIIKMMEAFVLGDTGLDGFADGQTQVYQLLEKEHYSSFIVSDIYHEYIAALESEPSAKSPLDDSIDGKESFSSFEVGKDVLFADQSYSIQKKLEKLDEKIVNKSQALATLLSSTKADSKFKKVVDDLKKELETLHCEKNQFAAYVQRTDLWWENQGKWKAQVHSADIVSEGDKLTPYFVIGVDVDDSDSLMKSEGWSISRTLADFGVLHEKLIQIGAWLKKKELPSTNKMWFKSIGESFLEKAKETLNNYLITVMKDDRMAQSEALFEFLSPAPDFLSQQTQNRSNWNFSLGKLFRKLPVNSDTDAEDEFLFVNCEGGKEEQNRDSIAEPLHHLINEIFELHGPLKWLRKSFIICVEAMCGGPINRQLRMAVDWMFSDSMLIYYIKTFKDSLWPNGILAEPCPPKTEEEKMKIRMEAKEKIIQNVPDVLKTLVGDDNARQGTIKIFEILQDVQLNKQLFYNVIELVLQEVCPELNIKFPSKHFFLSTGVVQ